MSCLAPRSRAILRACERLGRLPIYGVLLACISPTRKPAALLLSQLALREQQSRGQVIGSARVIWVAIDQTTRLAYGA